MDIKMTGIVFQMTFSAQLCQQKPMIDDILRYFLLREIAFTFLFLFTFTTHSICGLKFVMKARSFLSKLRELLALDELSRNR